jgi:Gas vesicle synthesis protein GvpL/GvpF
VVYVYAICRSPDLPDVSGHEGAPLSASGTDGLFAVWSEHEEPRLEADEASLWEHERVVEALLEEQAVLPMRFGSWVHSPDALLELLAARRDEFESGLERVGGAVEIGVRAMVHGEHSDLAPRVAGAVRPGTAYMLARLNEEQRSAAIAAFIHEPLAALSRAHAPRRASLSGSVNTAYLVARDDVGPFRSTVEKLDDTVDDATIVCTGPWPPYSFTPAESAR